MIGKNEKNEVIIARNVLYAKKYLSCSCFKTNSNREKQIILMIPNGEGWH